MLGPKSGTATSMLHYLSTAADRNLGFFLENQSNSFNYIVIIIPEGL